MLGPMQTLPMCSGGTPCHRGCVARPALHGPAMPRIGQQPAACWESAKFLCSPCSLLAAGAAAGCRSSDEHMMEDIPEVGWGNIRVDILFSFFPFQALVAGGRGCH